MSAGTQVSAGTAPQSIFQSDLSVLEKLERARTELLDLSARNRLLNMPKKSKSGRSIEIVDEISAEIFRLLVKEGKTFTFLAGMSAKPGDQEPEADVDEVVDLAQPEDDEQDERGVFSRHADTKLQTRLTPKGLQKKLLELYFDARTLEEEQGVNILYLTLGTLKWIDPNNAANIRFAPLLLVPVSLERGNAGEKFKLHPRADDFAANLSLEAYLDKVHGIRLPVFEASDDFDPILYMQQVAEATSAKTDWSVQADDISLGFFSFAKFLMYRDLDASSWPTQGAIDQRPLVKSLLVEGFETAPSAIGDDANIDPFISPEDMLHILDSDSSQTLAVHDVRQGKNMVIQGPPGTGKSQTIANIIASAIADGKTVLFVAEKMAALEVVKRRLDATGIGDACLELHSNKANKKALLEELRRTWELGAPKTPQAGSLFAHLTDARDNLNAHAARIHLPHPKAALSAYQVMGQLVRLRQSGQTPNDIALPGATDWSADDFSERRAVISELVERIKDIGIPCNHSWYGVGLASITPMDLERLLGQLSSLNQDFSDFKEQLAQASEQTGQPPADTFEAVEPLLVLLKRLASAPDLPSNALAASAWGEQREDILKLLQLGERHARLSAELAGLFVDEAWVTELKPSVDALNVLAPSFSGELFACLNAITEVIPELQGQAGILATGLSMEPPGDIASLKQLLEIGERVANAPVAAAEAYGSPVWALEIERAAFLAESVRALESCRQALGDKLAEGAWQLDLTAARTTLAAHGTGFFKIFSGEWRKANRLVRSVLTHPDQPLPDTLAQLDTLARGQTALKAIDEDDDFAKSAFASHWRKERSASAPLLALVEWMRSAQHLGALARDIVASGVDPKAVASSVARTQSLFDGLSPSLTTLWEHQPSRQPLFDNASALDDVKLSPLHQQASLFHEAQQKTVAAFVQAPDDLVTRLEALNKLIEGQACCSQIGENNTLGQQAFADQWQGLDSSWRELSASAQWIIANDDIRQLASTIEHPQQLGEKAEQITQSMDSVLTALAHVVEYLQLDLSQSLGTLQLREITIERLATRLEQWLTGSEQLSKWVAYRDRAERTHALGCADVVSRLQDGTLAVDDAVPAFEMAYFELLHKAQLHLHPELARFDGTLHNRLTHEFIDLDLKRLALSGVEVVKAHHKRVPPREGGALGPLGVLRGEIQKKRGHMPIRRLMEKAGPAVQALKPVFMMSPLSIAQFLTPGVFDFDLLVMDEASQIQPVDALGAIARAKQVVVVGDPRQLPPTAFFSKMTASDADDDDNARVGDIESILGLFSAKGLPTRMLRWHYRSKHQSLIAVSNRQFYENKLFIVPSPYTAEAGMGLRFHHIREGLFDAGGASNNQVEAKAVAKAIIRHAIDYPELSLGVVAFSTAQRKAIFEQLELLRRSLPPEIEAFFQQHYSEPFFVKNLENVQGDERDVIFISVGYGPTTLGGKVPMRFGPLGKEGGERRLNVLISRAKQRCEVFSSMTDDDIDPEFAATRKGIFAFRMFLHFARTGQLSMTESTGGDHQDVFQDQVAKALQERGYQVHRRVGLAGLFIDLAVADSDHPGRYLLGIECDGQAYHDARSARDRDRLRQSVLESHGWALHRLWISDWFQRPSEQLAIIEAKIAAAKAEQENPSRVKATRAIPFDIVTVDREDVTEIGLVESGNEAPASELLYTEVQLVRPSHISDELHEAPTGMLAELVKQTVQTEGPVHVGEVVDRIRNAWELKKAGSRIKQAIDAAIEVNLTKGWVAKDAEFLFIPGAPVKARDRSSTLSPNLRKADMLPPAEIQAALQQLAVTNFGASREQMVQGVSRIFGIRSTSAPVRAVIEAQIEVALSKGYLIEQAGILVSNPASPT